MILRAGSAHADLLAALHARSYTGREAWDAPAFTALLNTPGLLAWIDDRGGLLLVRVAADQADILTIAVDPPRRRAGIAAGLLAHAAAALTSLDVATLFLDVAETNHAALSLYFRAGFEPAGRRRAYYSDGADALLMRRTLSRA